MIDDVIIQNAKNLQPTNFGLKQLVRNLHAWHVQALPEEYATSLIHPSLGTLIKVGATGCILMQREDHRHHVMESLNTTTENALFMKPKLVPEKIQMCKCKSNTPCDFCEKAGHCIT